jgi:hypothetical protein
MNIKLIIFCGLVTSVLGAVMGLAVGEISRGDLRQIRYESQFYHNLHNKYPLIIGAGLGFAIGVAEECVRELQKKKDQDLFDSAK